MVTLSDPVVFFPRLDRKGATEDRKGLGLNSSPPSLKGKLFSILRVFLLHKAVCREGKMR